MSALPRHWNQFLQSLSQHRAAKLGYRDPRVGELSRVVDFSPTVDLACNPLVLGLFRKV